MGREREDPSHARGVRRFRLGVVCGSVLQGQRKDLTVRAALEGSRDHVYHAAMLDRHAASVLSLDEIAEMVDELIEAHGEAMPKGVRTAARKPPR